jgi:hypothetical protein
MGLTSAWHLISLASHLICVDPEADDEGELDVIIFKLSVGSELTFSLFHACPHLAARRGDVPGIVGLGDRGVEQALTGFDRRTDWVVCVVGHTLSLGVMAAEGRTGRIIGVLVAIIPVVVQLIACARSGVFDRHVADDYFNGNAFPVLADLPLAADFR